MDQVSFSAMDGGTQAVCELLDRAEAEFVAQLPARLLAALDRLKSSFAGYQVSRYEHSLQSATRAQRAGRSEEYVAAALLHDIGDELAPYTHGEMVAAIMRPFIAPEICWIVEHHGIFQQFHYGTVTGDDPNARDVYRDHPSFGACAEFCALYDQNCFDPDFESDPIESFVPIVERVFSVPRYLTAH
jgi:predicted HD phosphohydrolase